MHERAAEKKREEARVNAFIAERIRLAAQQGKQQGKSEAYARAKPRATNFSSLAVTNMIGDPYTCIACMINLKNHMLKKA